MALTEILLVYAAIAGIMSVMLFAFSIFVERNKQKSRKYLIWAVLFLAAAFSATEYAFWLNGEYLYYLLLTPNVPLLFYFAIWLAFVVWVFESRGERKIWIIFSALLILLLIAAFLCPDCIRF